VVTPPIEFVPEGRAGRESTTVCKLDPVPCTTVAFKLAAVGCAAVTATELWFEAITTGAEAAIRAWPLGFAPAHPEVQTTF